MRSLPLDSLKIAKEFIDGMTSTPDDEALVRLIVELARLRGLRVVAEGIETADQLDALRALHCDRGQGVRCEGGAPRRRCRRGVRSSGRAGRPAYALM
jgi:EAL domain-containing protein (putative c-di-GMP-specific phosphodiesterase class I)